MISLGECLIMSECEHRRFSVKARGFPRVEQKWRGGPHLSLLIPVNLEDRARWLICKLEVQAWGIIIICDGDLEGEISVLMANAGNNLVVFECHGIFETSEDMQWNINRVLRWS